MREVGSWDRWDRGQVYITYVWPRGRDTGKEGMGGRGSEKRPVHRLRRLHR